MQIRTGLIGVPAAEAQSRGSDVVTRDGIIEPPPAPIWNKPPGARPFVGAGLEADASLRGTRTSPKALAAIVAKNRGNGLRNPLAAYGAAVDADQAMRSEERFAPLRALDISNPADGCVVLVVASDRAAKKLRANPVWIRGIGWASDSPSLETRDWTGATYARIAADMAYRLAKVRRPLTDIDFAEVDDRFSYKELQHLESLGFAKKGEAGTKSLLRDYDADGRLPVHGSD